MLDVERPAEGFIGFGDREPFELPKANEDIKLSRYLFTAASLTTPQIGRERPHMSAGGVNIFNPCLRQSGDFIRRGRITPLLINQHIPVPVEEANSENSNYFSIPAGGDGFTGQGPLAEAGGYMGYLAYPGQQIIHILEGTPNVDGSGQRLGIVELTSLKGHEYKLEPVGRFQTDKELWKIQCEIFPEYPKLPGKLSEFTEQIKRAIDSHGGVTRDVATEMLPSCTQFELWAVRSIERVHQNMAQAAAKGYASPYDDIDLIVLDQLGMHREDEHYKRTAQQAVAQQIDPQSLVAMMREAGKENREMFMEGMSQLIREWKSEGQSAPPADEIKYDLNGERPANVHHKTWEKMRREAGLDSEPQASE